MCTRTARTWRTSREGLRAVGRLLHRALGILRAHCAPLPALRSGHAPRDSPCIPAESRAWAGPYLLPRPARSGSGHLDQLGRLNRHQVSAGGGQAGVSELKLDVPHAHALAQQLGRMGGAAREPRARASSERPLPVCLSANVSRTAARGSNYSSSRFSSSRPTVLLSRSSSCSAARSSSSRFLRSSSLSERIASALWAGVNSTILTARSIASMAL